MNTILYELPAVASGALTIDSRLESYPLLDELVAKLLCAFDVVAGKAHVIKDTYDDVWLGDVLLLANLPSGKRLRCKILDEATLWSVQVSGKLALEWRGYHGGECWDYRAHSNHDAIMQRAAYRLGISKDGALEGLDALSQHEMLELRLDFPRALWPIEWPVTDTNAA